MSTSRRSNVSHARRGESGLRWIGLEVRHTPVDGEHATVEFVARSKVGGRAERMHVFSRFERVEGRWLYVEDEDAAP